MIKKIKYLLENFIYKIKYKKIINIDEFKIKENKFSGKN